MNPNLQILVTVLVAILMTISFALGVREGIEFNKIGDGNKNDNSCSLRFTIEFASHVVDEGSVIELLNKVRQPLPWYAANWQIVRKSDDVVLVERKTNERQQHKKE